MKKTILLPLIGAEPIEIEAWLPSPSSYLAVHRLVRDGGFSDKEWSVTHIPTGMRVVPGEKRRTRRDALNLARVLEPESAAWNFSTQAEISAEARQIWERACASA